MEPESQLNSVKSAVSGHLDVLWGFFGPFIDFWCPFSGGGGILQTLKATLRVTLEFHRQAKGGVWHGISCLEFWNFRARNF